MLRSDHTALTGVSMEYRLCLSFQTMAKVRFIQREISYVLLVHTRGAM